MSAAATGILARFGSLFQLGYVTDDLDRAMDEYRKLGVDKFRVVDVGAAAGRPGPHGARIAMAWLRELMIEIIQPIGEPAPVYVDDLPPPPGRRCSFNHVGIAVPNRSAWDGLLAEIARQRLPVAWHGSDPARFDVAYVDTRLALGHYSEFIHICPLLADMFAQVPRNG